MSWSWAIEVDERMVDELQRGLRRVVHLGAEVAVVRADSGEVLAAAEREDGDLGRIGATGSSTRAGSGEARRWACSRGRTSTGSSSSGSLSSYGTCSDGA